VGKKTEITIHDIARELNVSASTVSRALNNNPRISKITREKIQSKAIEMGYRPNVIASNLRSQKTNTIGVIVPRIDRHFFSTAISGIEDYAWANNLNIIFAQSNDLLEKEEACVYSLFNKRVDGLIISISMETVTDKHFKVLTDKNLPLVFFDRFCPTIESDRIVTDDFDSVYIATKHLAEQGCNKIAHIAGPEFLNIYADRKAGYESALKDSNLECRKEYILMNNLTRRDGEVSIKKLLSLPDPPDAILCGNDTTALSVLNFCKENNIKVPSDLALVGFSDEPFSAVTSPSITTVRQPGYQIGVESAKCIVRRINSPNEIFPFETTVLKSELIIRESSVRLSVNSGH
jgi:LacI family transcriptional regulator